MQKLSNLTNLTTPKIQGSDKVKYGVANFCAKIGCTSISNYFMKKISSENLTKIHSVEKALTETIKISEVLKQQNISEKGVGAVESKVTKMIESRQKSQLKKQQSRHV